jgi:uncharacterized protein (TIGR01732 family)
MSKWQDSIFHVHKIKKPGDFSNNQEIPRILKEVTDMSAVGYGGGGYGSGFALVVVLFILLIIIGASFSRGYGY